MNESLQGCGTSGLCFLGGKLSSGLGRLNGARLRCMFNLAALRPLHSFLRGERRAKQAPLPCQGHTRPYHQRCQFHVQPGFKTKPDSSLVADANLLAPMELDYRPCEAALAGSRL